METDKLLDAVRSSVCAMTVDHLQRYATADTSEQGICDYMGPLTTQVASRMGTTNAHARRWLNKLVEQGLILKSQNNGNMVCRWWPVGHLQELLAGA